MDIDLPVDAAYAAAHRWPGARRAVAPRAAVLMALRLAADAPAAWPWHLDAPVQAMLAAHAAELAGWIALRHRGRPRVVGLAGGQGSGKSTLAQLTGCMLEREFGLRAAVLALDDLYLPKAERQRLAGQVHPLFATRGVPGTHDAALGEALIDALTHGAGPVAMPRFDKGGDDRLDASWWPTLEAPVDVVLFEGWCVGAEPEPVAALTAPVNDLERQQDPDGRWRRAVNDALSVYRDGLFAAIEALVFLAVPDFAAVLRWREAQEAQLRQHAAGAMTPDQVSRFVAHYERLTRAMLRQAPATADLILRLDGGHRVARVEPGGAWRTRGFRRHSAPRGQHGRGSG